MKMPNGAVLPSGLLEIDRESILKPFEKLYNNVQMRIGIVVNSYSVKSKKNISKTIPEYDVLVIESDAQRGSVPVTYKNCACINGFGGIGDYFEYTLRPQKKVKDKRSGGKDFAGQDGSIVLLLCLDGNSKKAVIMGAITHPDRQTKLTGEGQALAGEFNGISIEVKDDGSANLTFKGATDNEGKPKDSSQGNTTINIEKDGSIQFKHKGATQRIEKGGNFLLQNEGSSTITSKKDINFNTDAKFNLKAKSDTNISMDKFVLSAQGSASISAQGFDISGQTKIDLKSKMISMQADSVAKIQSAQITLEGNVFIGGAGGQPIVLSTTQFVGTGNSGAPVISNAIGPFTVKSFAT